MKVTYPGSWDATQCTANATARNTTTHTPTANLITNHSTSSPACHSPIPPVGSTTQGWLHHAAQRNAQPRTGTQRHTHANRKTNHQLLLHQLTCLSFSQSFQKQCAARAAVRLYSARTGRMQSFNSRWPIPPLRRGLFHVQSAHIQALTRISIPSNQANWNGNA
jgi:hypothetical protein